MGDRLDLVHEQPEAGAEIDQARVESRPRWRIEDEADRIFLAADRERVNLERRLGGGDRRTDFEHVRAQNLMPIGREMVGVVLHERCAAGQPFAHDLHRPHERGGLPVALGAKAVTIRHQPLRSEPRKLPKPMQVLEGRREAVEPASLEERAQSELEPGAVKERLVPLAAFAQFGRDLVSLLDIRWPRPSLSRPERRRPRPPVRRRHSRWWRSRTSSRPPPCRLRSPRPGACCRRSGRISHPASRAMRARPASRRRSDPEPPGPTNGRRPPYG